MNLDTAPKLPVLGEVLNGTAPPPYTLDDLRVFLNRNHCVEILDFLEHAKKYGQIYASIHTQLGNSTYSSLGRPEVGLLLQLWRSLMSTFILPGAPQEIDLFSSERSSLLIYRDATIPPRPSILQPVVRRLYVSIEETIFPMFLFCERD